MHDEFTSRKPRTTFGAYCGSGGALDWSKLMNYSVIIITEADLSDDPAFVHPFKVNTVDDFKVAVDEAIAEWQRYNPDRDFLEAGCTVLVEQAAFNGAAQPIAEVLT